MNDLSLTNAAVSRVPRATAGAELALALALGALRRGDERGLWLRHGKETLVPSRITSFGSVTNNKLWLRHEQQAYGIVNINKYNNII